MLDDRRKDYRVHNAIPVLCEIIDPKDKTVRKKNVLSNNISAGGIYFDIDEVLTLNTEIDITFHLPNNKIIRTTIKVVRIEVTGVADRYGIGASFINLSDEDKAEITKNLSERLNINKLLELAIEKGASDLHLIAGRSPFMRKSGEIQPLDWPTLSAIDIINLAYGVMTKEQIRNFEKNKELDFAIQYDILNRFRVNVHQQKGFIEAALRLINIKISTFEELNIPEVVRDFVRQKDGLIIIAGPTGCGKTTTIATMVQLINTERKVVIITMERPIEYVYPEEKSIIKQREVGIDTYSFSAALKSSLRQDPNIIVVGELDDIETVKTALIAAESGHLVIASFHAPNTIQAIDRLVNMFAPENRKQILSQLSHCLKGIVTQLLIPTKDKQKRVLVTEVLVATDAAKRIIRNDELIQIPNLIQTGAAFKMHLMSESIKNCLRQDIIDIETANFYSEEFNKYTR